jgi:hypothetical protein
VSRVARKELGREGRARTTRSESTETMRSRTSIGTWSKLTVDSLARSSHEEYRAARATARKVSVARS